MEFAEWGELSAEARRHVKWYDRPHIKTATLFSILLALLAGLFISGTEKNKTSHLNNKPDTVEAYTAAPGFVKADLKFSASAEFSKTARK